MLDWDPLSPFSWRVRPYCQRLLAQLKAFVRAFMRPRSLEVIPYCIFVRKTHTDSPSVYLSGGREAFIWDVIERVIGSCQEPLLLFVRDVEATICGSFNSYDGFVASFGAIAQTEQYPLTTTYDSECSTQSLMQYTRQLSVDMELFSLA